MDAIVNLLIIENNKIKTPEPQQHCDTQAAGSCSTLWTRGPLADSCRDQLANIVIAGSDCIISSARGMGGQ